MRRILIPLLLALALVCLGVTAGADGNGMKFDMQNAVVFEGETLQTVLNREGAAAEGEVVYQTANANVATVDEAGVVTGVSKGRTTITATVKTEKQTFRAQIPVTVARKATSLALHAERLKILDPADENIAGLLKQRDNADENALPVLVLPMKSRLDLRVATLPQDATSRNVVLTAAEDGVISVRGTSVNAVATGDTVLTIANDLSPEVNLRYRVLVVQPVSRITVRGNAQSVAAGSQIELNAEITPADASIQGVTWSSQDERIATVDENGVLTGVARGNARIVATAKDGSNVRANFSIAVTQNAESITLDKTEGTVDTGRSIMFRATVMPQNTSDKSVVWSSSDESVATVNNQGRVTGVSLGDCEIICTSKSTDTVTATATVHVQQPVTGITFGDAPVVYAGETGKLSWSVQPENASNPAIKLTSGNTRILTVDEDGTVTGIKQGEANVDAVSTDGSNRRARIHVKVLQHVTGVHMKRHTAYIDVGETSIAGAVLEPNNASNKNMTWESADTGVSTVEPMPKQPNRVKITGVAQGDTVVTGTTEDGGFQTSITVKIGDWDHALHLENASVSGSGLDVYLTVKNNSVLTITQVTAQVTVLDANGKEVPCNKDGSTSFKMVYQRTLAPGATTNKNQWKMVDFQPPESLSVSQYVFKIVQYQIDNDWVKNIRKKYQPTKKIPIHL